MTRTASARLAAVLLCAVASADLLRAAQNRPSSAPTLTIDFLAVGSDGRPIRDLKPEDLTLRMDAKTRTVRSLQLVAVTDAPGTGLTTAADIPAPFATNVVSQVGRGFVIVIDDESLRVGEERRTKEAIAQLLAELPAADRIAIVTVPHGGIKADFTTDRDKIRQALAPIVGQAKSEQLVGQEAACQTRLVLDTLVGTLSSLAGGGASPTTFIVLTAGLVGPRSDTIRIGATVGQCELTPEAFQSVAAAAADAHAQFYLVQAEHQLMGQSANNTALFGGNDNPAVGLEHLAGVNGTKILPLPTTGDNPLIRIARETSAHYLVTFDVEPNDLNNNSHKLDIKTARSDATLRVRPLLTLGKANTKANAAKNAGDTLRDANAYRGLPLRTAVFTSKNSGDDKIKVVATIEPLDSAATLTQVVAGVYDGDKLIGRWTSKPEDVATRPILAALLVPPGNYRLRAAANDAAGHLGAVDTPLAAELTAAGPLKISSLVLGGPKPAGGFAPHMEFGGEPNAIAYVEIYGGKPNLQVAGVVELAESVNGPALQSISIQWGATDEAGKYNGVAQLALGSLKPGDYVVRAIIGVVGEPEGRVLRTLRKR